MNRHTTKKVEKTMTGATIHNDWVDKYRNSDNIYFFKIVIKFILNILNIKNDTKILEVGCGTCTKSIILAENGYRLTAIDLSEDVLNRANLIISESILKDRIFLKHENLLDLSFKNKSFDCVLCWGVLMHIPELEKALKELSRIIKKNGFVIIAENNMFSLQSHLYKIIKFILRKDNTNVHITETGKESWSKTSEGALLVREMDINWFKKKMANYGFEVEMHIPGQFFEMYTLFSSPIIKKLIHCFNLFWFKYIKSHHFALSNIIVFKKIK